MVLGIKLAEGHLTLAGWNMQAGSYKRCYAPRKAGAPLDRERQAELSEDISDSS